jgi:hypothetical protein
VADKSGRYDLEINVLSDTVCLNSLRPRLNIVASNWDFCKLNERYENLCLASFFVGLPIFVAFERGPKRAAIQAY